MTKPTLNRPQINAPGAQSQAAGMSQTMWMGLEFGQSRYLGRSLDHPRKTSRGHWGSSVAHEDEGTGIALPL